jgi:cytochrome c2
LRFLAVVALLLASGQAVRASADDLEWAGFSRQLAEKSMVALKAAQLEAGNDVYQVCEDCHKVYLPQPK